MCVIHLLFGLPGQGHRQFPAAFSLARNSGLRAAEATGWLENHAITVSAPRLM